MTSEFENTPSAAVSSPQPKREWQALTRNQRRVLGVLIEKSKTTPDVYPMSLNGIKTGCNQKSNRSPILDLTEEQVEEVLYELRHLGCVIEVHSGGRVPKFKHMAYDWFSVTKNELGVMAELLLRGEQTVGELRVRSSRMEKEIETIDDLMPILRQLLQKELVIELTPAGRGQIVSHNLYQENELTRLQADIARQSGSADAVRNPEIETNPAISLSVSSRAIDSADRVEIAASPLGVTAASPDESWKQRLIALETTVAELKQQFDELKRMIES